MTGQEPGKQAWPLQCGGTLGRVAQHREQVVAKGVPQVRRQVLHRPLARDVRFQEEAQHGKHGQAPVLDLLHLQDGKGLGVGGQVQGVEVTARVQGVQALRITPRRTPRATAVLATSMGAGAFMAGSSQSPWLLPCSALCARKRGPSTGVRIGWSYRSEGRVVCRGVVLGAPHQDDLGDGREQEVGGDGQAEVVDGVALQERGASLHGVAGRARDNPTCTMTKQ